MKEEQKQQLLKEGIFTNNQGEWCIPSNRSTEDILYWYDLNRRSE